MDQFFCLSAQGIRTYISQGKIQVLSEDFESSVQPSSFEPNILGTCYILDSERGVCRPNPEFTVQELLDNLVGLQRIDFDAVSGFEIKVGFTYLFPLDASVCLDKGEFLLSSPKSTFGRLFLHTRLVADYSNTFDEVDNYFAPGKHLQLWLLVQPRAFNVIVYPGLALNQLRFFTGPGCRLTDSELLLFHKQFPLVYGKTLAEDFTPLFPLIRQGVQLHLDLRGQWTHGVVGFRARRTPIPIDTHRLSYYSVEDFFYPLFPDDRDSVLVERGEHYLFATQEVFSLPDNLNAQLPVYSGIGVAGPLHFAGFIDNGFFGDLVLEVSPEESASLILTHGMPLGRLEYFRTPKTDKSYGPVIGSHYRGQIGPRPAKYFKSVNYSSL